MKKRLNRIEWISKTKRIKKEDGNRLKRSIADHNYWKDDSNWFLWMYFFKLKQGTISLWEVRSNINLLIKTCEYSIAHNTVLCSFSFRNRFAFWRTKNANRDYIYDYQIKRLLIRIIESIVIINNNNNNNNNNCPKGLETSWES